MSDAYLITCDDDLQHYLDECEFLECRALRHAWKRTHRGWIVSGSGSATMYSKTLVCLRCNAQRVNRRNARHERERPHYILPDGYRVKGALITPDLVDVHEIQEMTRAKAKQRKGAT